MFTNYKKIGLEMIRNTFTHAVTDVCPTIQECLEEYPIYLITAKLFSVNKQKSN